MFSKKRKRADTSLNDHRLSAAKQRVDQILLAILAVTAVGAGVFAGVTAV